MNVLLEDYFEDNDYNKDSNKIITILRKVYLAGIKNVLTFSVVVIKKALLM